MFNHMMSGIEEQMFGRPHTHVRTDFAPALEAAGVGRDIFDAMLNDNPAGSSADQETEEDQLTEPRIAPVSDVPPDLGEVLGATLMRDGKPINIFGTLGRNPAVLKHFNQLAGYLLTGGILPAREREIVILRVGSNCRSVYEFGQHTLIGRSVGLTDDEILMLTRPAGEGNWSPDDRALVDLADDLCATDDVSDATWSALAGRWNEAELVELLVVAGLYRLVSGFLNAARVQLDAGVPGWPEP